MTLEGYGKCTLKNNKQRGHLGSAPTTLSGWPHKCRDFQGLILKLPPCLGIESEPPSKKIIGGQSKHVQSMLEGPLRHR